MKTQPRIFYGWWIVGSAFIFMMMIVGFVLYGLPQFYDRYVEQFHWSRANIQLGNTVSKIVIGPLFGFLAGWAIDRVGPRQVMLFGSLCAGLALWGFSVMDSLWQLYLFYFFNALGYVCAGPLPCQVLLSTWFTRLRGRVMGIAYVGIGVGGTIVPWLIYQSSLAYGWRGALRVMAVLVLAVLVLLAILIVRRRPADLGLLPDGVPQSGQPAAKVVPVRLWWIVRTPAFWLLAAGSILSIAAIGGITQNLPLYLVDIKSKEEAQVAKAAISSLMLFSSIAGRLFMGWMADRFRKKYVMLITYLIVALSIPLLIFARDVPGLLYVFAVIFGFGLGADYMLIPLMAAECFGLAALSRVLGLIITSDSIGEALMPYVVAHIRDLTGSYHGGFILLTGVALLGAAAILGIRYRDGIPVSALKIAEAGSAEAANR